MKRITRERSKIYGVACPWLIARFIDDAPEFSSCRRGRCGAWQMQREPFRTISRVSSSGHVGELCSFDAFLKKYGLQKPALSRIAGIVRGADTSHHAKNRSVATSDLHMTAEE